MAKNDFTTNSTKFLPTNEQDDSDIFNVGTSPNLGIGSQLKVEVTASKQGSVDLTDEVLDNDAVIIVQAIDSNALQVPSEFSTIQSAINASSDGDSIMVADGTYREAINFKRKKITITGNVINPSQCIIDGRKSENGDPVEAADWSRPFSDPTKVSVVTVDTREPGQCYDGDAPDELDEDWSKSLRVLEGFQIQNGMQGTRYPGKEPGCEPRSFSNGCICDVDCVGPDAPINCIDDSCGNASCQTNPPPDHCPEGELPFMGDLFVGGGLWAYRSKLTVRNCNFINNESDAGTGAFARECDVSFTSCEFDGNVSRSNGGGLQINHSISLVSNCTLTNNVADGSAFPDGAGYGNGGGLHQFSGQAVIQNCTFTDNIAKLIGGVSFATRLVPNFQHTHGDSTLSNCTIESNTSTGTETIDPKCGGVAITTQDSDSDGVADATVTISKTKMCNNISGSADSDFDFGDISSAWFDEGGNEICAIHFVPATGACCECINDGNGEPDCQDNVTELDCTKRSGVWFKGMNCSIEEPCADVKCGSDDFTDERLPVARWTEVPNIHRGSDFYVTLSAEHYHGIEKVEFSVDGETPIIVTSKSNHPETSYPEYLLPIDVSDLTPGRHEVTAKVTSKSGEAGSGVLTLAGDPHRFRNLDRRNNGINSFFFHTGEQVTETVGTNGTYADLEALFFAYKNNSLDPRGLRVEMLGNQIHTANEGDEQNGVSSALNDRFKNDDNRRPIEIVGMNGAEFRGTFGRVKNVSWSFQNMEFLVGNGESYINEINEEGEDDLVKEWRQAGGIPAIAQGNRSVNGISPEVSFINCTFAPDPAITHIFVDRSNACNNLDFVDEAFEIDHGNGVGSEPWRFNDWQQIHNTSAFVGGVYCVGNTYDSIALGPERVTLSKHDKFSKMGWDHLPKNPAGVFDFYSDRSSKDCLYHQNHTDFIQYFRSEAPSKSLDEPDDTRNRMFCDFYGTNFSAQIGHFEGTQSLIDGNYFEKTRGPKEPSTYKDFYFTRWTVDSNASSVSMNFVADEMVNWTVTDMKFSDCALDSIPGRPATGLIFDKLITAKLRLGDSGRLINIPFEDNGIGSFEDGETVRIEIDEIETATATVDMWLPEQTFKKDIVDPDSGDVTEVQDVTIPVMQVYNGTIKSTNADTDRNKGFPNTTLDFGDPTGNEVIKFIGDESGAIWKPRGLHDAGFDENGDPLYRDPNDGISNYGDGYTTAPKGKTPEYFTEKLLDTPNFLRDNGHIIRNWWVNDGGNGANQLSDDNQGGGVRDVSWKSRDPEVNESGLETPCAGQLGYNCGDAEQITWRDVANIDLTITGPQALLSSWDGDEFWTEFTGQQ